MATAEELRRAMRRDRIIIFERPFEDGPAIGYVAGVGTKIFTIAAIDHTVRFDGFQSFPVRDARKLGDAPNSRFIAEALELRPEPRPEPPELDRSGFGPLIEGVAQHFPLITIHRERVAPDVCHVGFPIEVTETTLRLRAIRPDGVWEPNIEDHSIDEISRVDFGGHYEVALHLVGGDAPR